MRIQAVSTIDLLADPAAVLAVAGPDLAREVVIGVRQEVSAQLDQLVAFEEDLTVHHIAVRILTARPAATAVELGSDD